MTKQEFIYALKELDVNVVVDETFDADLHIKEIKLKSVKQNGRSIEYINRPSEAVQLAAVKRMLTVLNIYPTHPTIL